jgi:hypothetical protein
MTITLYSDGEDLVASVLNRPLQDLLSALVIDVNTPPSSPVLNDVLKFDGTRLVFGAGGGGGATALDDLTDVIITAPSTGQALRYDASGKWINAFLNEVDINNLEIDLANINTDITNVASPQFITLVSSGYLPNERVLTAGSAYISLVDGGAGSTITIDVVNVAKLNIAQTFTNTQTIQSAGSGWILQFRNTANTAPSLFITTNGQLDWGDGSAFSTDAHLYRSAAATLSIGPNVIISGTLNFDNALGTGIVKHTTATGALSIAIGSDLPSHTHVKADITDFAHTHPESDITNLVTDLANRGILNASNLWGDGTAQTYQVGTVGGVGSLFLITKVSGEANNRFVVDFNGGMQWGAGGASALDVNLYRYTTASLKIDGSLYIGTDFYVSGNTNLGSGTLSFGAGLATGLVKHTTGTGLLSIAIGSDLPSHTHSASDITSGLLANARIATGTPDGTKFLRDDQVWTAVGGTGAPTTAQYVVLALDAGLSAERVLTGTANRITLSDGGANGNITLDVGNTIARLDISQTFSGDITQSLLCTTATTIALSLGVTGDTITRFSSNFNGQLRWGPGGSTSKDVIFERIGASLMQLTGALTLTATLDSTYASPGTAGTAPLYLTPGTKLGTPEEGAIEFDGDAFYGSVAASHRGVMVMESFVTISTGTVSFTDDANAHPVFGSSNDEFNVEASTAYFFEGFYELTGMGATTRTTATLFGGTATLNAIRYYAIIQTGTANALGTTQSTKSCIAATAQVLNATATTAAEFIWVRGIVRINAAGTFIPQVKHSAGTAGTILVQTNTFFRIYPIGITSVAAVGNFS